MAWIYSQALRVGDEVTITLREPTSGRSKELRLLRNSGETEAAFVARGQEMVSSNLRVLEGMRGIELDVTNIFRPGPLGGAAEKALDEGKGDT